jgi:isochorismate synthase
MGLLRTTSLPMPAAAAETRVAPLSALGRAGFAWAHQGLEARAFGDAARREGPLRAVLSDLTAPSGMPDDMPGPWVGAAAFDGTLGPGWSGFAAVRFSIPALLAWRRRGRQFVAAFGEGAQARVDDARRRLDADVHFPDKPAIEARRLRSPDERMRWDALVARALAAISSGALDKVVLARAFDVQWDGPLDAEALLASLQARHPACRSFLIRGEDGVFLGASPELLCRIEGDHVVTEALAGSAPPALAETLLGSRKDLREHNWVVGHIVRALSTLCESIERKPEPGLRRLANVAHLETPISARLARGRTVADVVAALHPTPAVGGVPSAAARRFLAEHERLDRGLYAGVVGWAGPGRAELAVALRCALVRGRTARVFAGAGIVEGSTAPSEWDETELKARALLDALGVQP